MILDKDDHDLEKENVTNALKTVRYVWAHLESDSFSLYSDLHMQSDVKSFKRNEIEFVDMGTCLANEEKNEKYYFIKMIHSDSKILQKRDVYILVFAEGQIHIWDNSLNM